jgi:toxin ParE1/3/4
VKYRVSFRPEAKADLAALYDFIAADAGPLIAGEYLDRIEAACRALATFPRRGILRNDIRQGLRIVGFERRAIIAFEVKGREVTIARVLYGGREFDHLLRSDDED